MVSFTLQPFFSGEGASKIQWTGGWEGFPGTDLDAVEKRQILLPVPGIELYVEYVVTMEGKVAPV